MEATIDRIIEKARSLGSVISAAKTQAASIPSPNAGGGVRTGKVASALSGSFSDRGMG
jgi:hypothetical protein